MEVLYNNSKKWVKFGKGKGIILAGIGTPQELMIGKAGLWNYQWSVSLIGGESHLLWGHNWGNSATIEEAKQKAENFLQIVYLFEKTNLKGNAEEVIANAQRFINDAKISAMQFKKDMYSR